MDTFGNGAQSHEWHMPVAPAEAYEALRASVDSLFKLRESDEFTMTVQFATKVSAMTWGDRCTAQVIRDGDESNIRVAVASRNASSPLVAGKSAKNMQALLKAITDRLKASRSS